MRYIDLKTKGEIESLPSDSVLCIGNFDGVHIGHRQLVDAVLSSYRMLSGERDVICGAWFFDSSSYKSMRDIFTVEEKLDIFAELGLEYAVIADFDEVRGLSPNRFVNEILRTDCRCIHAVCGENFRFGAMAAGDAVMLSEMMLGNATIVPLLSFRGDTVSSTRIRELLEKGLVEEASLLLGSRYSVCERIVHGKALGRTIGIPTINQNITQKELLISRGTYATVCTLRGERYYGVTNFGTRPTVESSERKNLETYIIDFSGDCYGEDVKIEFASRLRDEMRFDSVESLRDQIEKDIESTRSYFASEHGKR